MAEPYVPIANHTTYTGIMTDLEVTTNYADTNASDLDTAVTNSLSYKNTAENLLEAKFNIVFLVGC